jgi:hypothetical protein
MILIDCAANGSVCGDDILVIEGSERFVSVSGFGGHHEDQLQIATAQALIETHKGDIISVFHQTAFLGKGKRILSCLQCNIMVLRLMASLFDYQVFFKGSCGKLSDTS